MQKFFLGNKHKLYNRYTDVVCLDKTRVKLGFPNDEAKKQTKKFTMMGLFSDSLADLDYIHANYVSGFNSEGTFTDKTFIAAQGPTDETTERFFFQDIDNELSLRVDSQGRRSCSRPKICLFI